MPRLERVRSKVSCVGLERGWRADEFWFNDIEFTGISAPYEAPAKPEIHIRTDEVDVAGAVEKIVAYLQEKGLLSA
jgi:hypothetical protein